MRRERIAMLCASAAVLVGAGVAYFVTSAAKSAPEQQGSTVVTEASAVADEMVTLTLHATGDQQTLVMHTCADKAGKVAVELCSVTVSTTPGAWSERITVPVGTRVSVQVGGGMMQPWCSITDEFDRVPPLAMNHETGMCAVVAR